MKPDMDVPDISPRTKEELMKQKQLKQKLKEQHDKDVEIHTNPILPDLVDEYGNLPALTCGWSKCAKKFDTKDELLEHVKSCIPHTYVGRFHVNCKTVLENDPDLKLSDFIQKVRDCYDASKQHLIDREELIAYYNKFQPIFKKHEIAKDIAHPSAAQKETAEILFNFRIESQKILMEQEKHSHPLLPDNVDEYGNLPSLTCGWTKCNKTFDTKDELLAHVKRCIPHHYLGRFHVNCKNVLENHPDLTLTEFEQKVKDCYDESKHQFIAKDQLLAYYNQFQPVFKKHEIAKDVAHPSAAEKEKAEILFNFRIKSQKKLMEENNVPQQFIE